MIPSARERLTRVADSLPFAVRRAAVTVMATLLCLTPCLRSFAVTPAGSSTAVIWIGSLNPRSRFTAISIVSSLPGVSTNDSLAKVSLKSGSDLVAVMR